MAEGQSTDTSALLARADVIEAKIRRLKRVTVFVVAIQGLVIATASVALEKLLR